MTEYREKMKEPRKDGASEEMGGKNTVAESFSNNVCAGMCAEGLSRGKRKHLWAFNFSLTPSPIFKSTTKLEIYSKFKNLNMAVSLSMKAKAHCYLPTLSISLVDTTLWNGKAKVCLMLKSVLEQQCPQTGKWTVFLLFPSPSSTPEVNTGSWLEAVWDVKHKLYPIFQKDTSKENCQRCRSFLVICVFQSFT